MIPDLNAYSSLIQAVATVVLVFLTMYYVRQTRKTTEELERTRKSDFMPVLAVHMETRDETMLDLYLSNIGQGIAQRPTASIPFSKEVVAGEVIGPGQENILVTLHDVGVAEVLELPEEKRVIEVRYGDIFGRELQTRVYVEGDESSNQLVVKDWR